MCARRGETAASFSRACRLVATNVTTLMYSSSFLFKIRSTVWLPGGLSV